MRSSCIPVLLSRQNTNSSKLSSLDFSVTHSVTAGGFMNGKPEGKCTLRPGSEVMLLCKQTSPAGLVNAC